MVFEKILHVYYYDSAWHDSAFIIGDKVALKALYAALGKVIESDKDEAIGVKFFVNDGEGFSVVIIPEKDMEKMAVPYSNEYAQEKSKIAVWPWDLKKVKEIFGITKI